MDLFIVGALTASVIVGLTAALLLERARRLDLADAMAAQAQRLAEQAQRLAEQDTRLAEQAKRLAALERVDRNPLYRENIEDQRARQLSAAADVATGIDFMVQAVRTLAPEMLNKDHRK